MLKETVYYAFKNILVEKINIIRSSLDDLKEIGKNETKSTAGDKHETALAMVQLEQEKMRNQLGEALQQLLLFEKIDPNKSSCIGSKGSIVITDKGIFFLCIAMGKVEAAGKKIMSLSPDSPLGTKLIGCKAGETINLNNVSYFINEVS